MITKQLKWPVLAVAVTLWLCSSVWAADDKTRQKERIQLFDGMTATVQSVRCWHAFDGRLPATQHDEHWILGQAGLNARQLPSAPADIPPFVEGVFRIEQGQESLRFKRFGAVDSAPGSKQPSGSERHCEVVLRVTNDGSKPVRLTMSAAEQQSIAAHLRLADGTSLEPTAFRVPGLPHVVDPASLITEVQGRLDLELAPRRSTWLLLVFTVPIEVRSAALSIMTAQPMAIDLPPATSAAADKAAAEARKWKHNCAAVRDYHHKLRFMKSKTWTKGQNPRKAAYTLSTSREAFLELLEHFAVDKPAHLKKKLRGIVRLVRRAPAYKQQQQPYFPGATRGVYDMKVSEKLRRQMDSFLAGVEEEAAKHGVACR